MSNKYFLFSVKLVLITFSVLSYSGLFAQSYAYPEFYSSYNPLGDSLVKAKGISEFKIDRTNLYKRGKTYTYRSIYYYNYKGQTTFHCKIEDTSKYKSIVYASAIIQTFDDRYGSVTFNQFSNQILKGSHNLKIIHHHQDGKIKGFHYFNKKGKNKGSYEYEYENGLKTRMNRYNRKHKLKTYYKETYNFENKLTQSALYTAKGKLIRLWDYSCNDVGKLVKNKSDTLKICTEKSYLADGSIVTTTNSFDYKGQPSKFVYVISKANKLILRMQFLR
ncbi:MAG: hypothetical protein R2852_07925 [Bacteroidia bacterium]